MVYELRARSSRFVENVVLSCALAIETMAIATIEINLIFN